MAVQVLRHVVAAIAGAEHQRLLAAPGGAVTKAVRVHDVAGEIGEAGQVGDAGDAVGAVGEDDVARVHGPLGAGAAQFDRPGLGGGVVGAALDELEHIVDSHLQPRLQSLGRHVKEKVLGAKRAGIKKILLPKRNEMDLDDVPKEVRDTIEFSFVEELSEVFVHALGKRIITPVLLGVPDEGRRGNNVVALRPSANKRTRPETRKRRAAVTASRKRS